MAERSLRKRKKKPKVGDTKLRVALAPALPQTVPRRWVKFVIALFLLPSAWVLTQTFFTAFARATIHEQFWITEEFWFFALGGVLWIITFIGLPRPVWIYVIGHELTHALWVWLMGGRVSRIEITESGGHILASKTNTFIALAPYFFPIYSLLVIVVYGFAGLFWDMAPFRPMLYMLIGMTWAFHISFTLWMIPKGQTDLTYGGTFFSLTLIYIFNIALLSVFLIIASPGVTASGFAHELAIHAVEFFEFLDYWVRWARR